MTLIINKYNVIRSFNNIYYNPIRSGRAFLRMEIGSGSMSGAAQTYQDKGFLGEYYTRYHPYINACLHCSLEFLAA